MAQEIEDYKGDYTFTNSKFSMDGIRALITEENGKRTLQFNAKFPMGRIKIHSNFIEQDNLITSIKYFVDVKWTVFKDKRVLMFDQEENKLTSSGKFKWTQDLTSGDSIFDPLNGQIQIRKNVIAGINVFTLKQPNLKTGVIEDNAYQVIEDGNFQVGGKIYLCKVVKRLRAQEDRTTKYFLAPELNYLIVKVEDQDSDGDTLLELKKLY